LSCVGTTPHITPPDSPLSLLYTALSPPPYHTSTLSLLPTCVYLPTESLHTTTTSWLSSYHSTAPSPQHMFIHTHPLPYIYLSVCPRERERGREGEAMECTTPSTNLTHTCNYCCVPALSFRKSHTQLERPSEAVLLRIFFSVALVSPAPFP
jgi:hypothetical protein